MRVEFSRLSINFEQNKQARKVIFGRPGQNADRANPNKPS